MHSPDEFDQAEQVMDFFSSFSETCFASYDNPMFYLDLVSKLFARYQNDCSFIFAVINQLEEHGLLSEPLIQKIISNKKLNALQLFNALQIILKQQFGASEFDHIALLQMFSVAQKKVMQKCCYLDLYQEAYAEQLSHWLLAAPITQLLQNILSRIKSTPKDLNIFMNFADNFALQHKFHVFISIIALDQHIELSPNIINLFDVCKSPLLLTETLLNNNIVYLLDGPKGEHNIKLITESSCPEMSLLILHQLHQLRLEQSLESTIRDRINSASTFELTPFSQTLRYLINNPKLHFSKWQVLLDQLEQSLEILKLFVLLRSHQFEHMLETIIEHTKKQAVGQTYEMLHQMLLVYPQLTYHLNFLIYVLPQTEDCVQSFHNYIKLLTQKIYLHYLPPDVLFPLFFAQPNSVLIDLIIDFKHHGLLNDNKLSNVFNEHLLEFLTQPDTQLLFNQIHGDISTKEILGRQGPCHLGHSLEALQIMQECHLLTGYEGHKNTRLLLKSANIEDTCQKLKRLQQDNALNQESFEQSVCCLPSIFKKPPPASLALSLKNMMGP